MADTIAWLMDGDPAIRWQVMRDLLEAPAAEWMAERSKIAVEGWGPRMLEYLGSNGRWPKGRWTDNVWSLRLLAEIGMLGGDERLSHSFEVLVDWLAPKGEPVSSKRLAKENDLCHLGFWLWIGCRFSPGDERLKPLADFILNSQFADGGWNCRTRTVPTTVHSSFHTTFNVLEGLSEAAEIGVISKEVFAASEAKAVEFMIQHKMYRSDKTGQIVHRRFTELSYPTHWHYTVLRGLDYIHRTPGITDPRLADPLDLLESQRLPSGRWIVEKRIPGNVLFDMETMGKESRWNTLRAMRVLRAAGRIH